MHSAARGCHPPTELFALFGRHFGPSSSHTSTTERPTHKSPAKQNGAYRDETQRLPESNLVKVEQLRHQPIPKVSQSCAEYG
jgi:hypothetical protein